MVELFDKESGAPIGTISDAQFRFLAELFEEEGESDHDYYINADTLEMMEDEGAEPELVDILREGLAGREEMEISWERAPVR